MNILRTAECVSPRHPDKMCDRISDSILDWYLKRDAESRVAIETMGGNNKVYILGEVSSRAKSISQSEVEHIVKSVTSESKLKVEFHLNTQSSEIAQGVDLGGAGDQGIMIGYACNENASLITDELYLARDLCRYIYNQHQYDGKTQVTIDNFGYINTVVASFCKVKSDRLKYLVNEWLKLRKGRQSKVKIYCNPAGDWNIGGFAADTGLTGRKLAVDNYGPQIPLGGGAFSGKDASKVDRSGAYMARKIAVDILKKEKAKEVLVKIAYAIGISYPVMVTAEVDGRQQIITTYDLRPRAIIKLLDLKRPNFALTAKWGHFGNGFLWDE